MPSSRTQHAAAVCGGKLYVVGGAKALLYVFDPGLRQGFQRDGNLGFNYHCSFTNHHEKLYKIGGKDSKQGTIGSASEKRNHPVEGAFNDENSQLLQVWSATIQQLISGYQL